LALIYSGVKAGKIEREMRQIKQQVKKTRRNVETSKGSKKSVPDNSP